MGRFLLLIITAWSAVAVPVDVSKYSSASRVLMEAGPERVELRWRNESGLWRILRLNLKDESRLIDVIAGKDVFLRASSPVFLLTIGSRDMDPRRGWIRFFDKVHKRPYVQHRVGMHITGARVSSQGRSTTVSIDRLVAGSFTGRLEFTVYDGCGLIQVEAVLTTEEKARAIVYDAGIVSEDEGWKRTVFLNSRDRWRELDRSAMAAPLAVRHRTVIADTDDGAVAVLPPPHRYFYPLDFADNFGFTWQGRGYRGLVPESGLGIRQPLDGDQRFVPWFNAPPGTEQRLGFFLLAGERSKAVFENVKRYTRGDRFKALPGYKTFTSHYHVEHTLDLISRRERSGKEDEMPADLVQPGFKQVFEKMGVDVVHLAEFHRGRTPRLQTPERLRQLRLMHDECDRLSTDDFLLLPGEEPNVHLGGHWISFFPKPVYWVLNRSRGEPFVEEREGFGKVYHVGNSADVLKLFELENGLKWTAHARIKSSTGYPDAYRHRPYYESDRFLGAAWKAMPGDLSRDRLGERVLQLEDDMANWGTPKYILGEVDVFKIQPDYELWGHMNVNYLKLDRLPRYRDGWQPILDVLRRGEFFVTTGELLLPRVEVSTAQVRVRAEWTFPPSFALIVSGDGSKVFQKRFSLRDRRAFQSEALEFDVDLSNRKWARLEIWDVAGNGAFTQPVWLKPER